MKLKAGHRTGDQYWLIEPGCADYLAVFNSPLEPDRDHNFLRGDNGPLHLLMCQEHCTSVDVIAEAEDLCGSNTPTEK